MWFPMTFSWGFFVPYLVVVERREVPPSRYGFRSSFSRSFHGKKTTTLVVHGRIVAQLVALWYAAKWHSRRTLVVTTVTPHVTEQQSSA